MKNILFSQLKNDIKSLVALNFGAKITESKFLVSLIFFEQIDYFLQEYEKKIRVEKL